MIRSNSKVNNTGIVLPYPHDNLKFYRGMLFAIYCIKDDFIKLTNLLYLICFIVFVLMFFYNQLFQYFVIVTSFRSLDL